MVKKPVRKNEYDAYVMIEDPLDDNIEGIFNVQQMDCADDIDGDGRGYLLINRDLSNTKRRSYLVYCRDGVEQPELVVAEVDRLARLGWSEVHSGECSFGLFTVSFTSEDWNPNDPLGAW